MRPLVSSVLALIPGLLRRLLCGAAAERCPLLSMKTKKPMKPMLEIVEITDDAGLADHPASAPTSRPSHPIHRGNARVVRIATAYSGTTTPQPRKLPAALVTRAVAAKVSAAAASVACSAGLAST